MSTCTEARHLCLSEGSDTKTALICSDWKDRKPCDGLCGTLLDKSSVTPQDWKCKQSAKHSYLYCGDCRSRGLSKKDCCLYKCTHCKSEFGCKRFDDKMLDNFKASQQQKLECKSCSEVIATRLKQWESALKESKRVCKCFQSFHSAKCPQTPCYHGEKRWPGSDGHITFQDMQFLNGRKSPPKWWWQARGRQ